MKEFEEWLDEFDKSNFQEKRRIINKNKDKEEINLWKKTKKRKKNMKN